MVEAGNDDDDLLLHPPFLPPRDIPPSRFPLGKGKASGEPIFANLLLLLLLLLLLTDCERDEELLPLLCLFLFFSSSPPERSHPF